LPSPLYFAVMVCVPIASAVAELLAAPLVRLTMARVVVPSRKVTVPVGAGPVPVTVAPSAMAAPTVAVAGVAVRATVGVSRLIMTVCAAEVRVTKLLSPP